MLWTGFKFVMVPIGVQLAQSVPKEQCAPVFAAGRGLLSGHRHQRRGFRIIVRPSTGIVAGFMASLILCVWVVTADGLGTPWLVLSLVLAISNTLLELYSPRGTDDFTIATANALICWAFGVWFR